MKFASSLIAAAMFALASAKVAFTNGEFNVQEGKPFKLEWSGNSGPVDIVFVAGPDDKSLVPVKPVTSGATGTSFTFTPSNLPAGTYAFRITDTTDPSNPNFSVPFQYVGTGTLSTSGVSSITSAASTSITSAVSTTSSSAFSAPTSSHSSTSSRSTSTSATTTAPTSRPTNTNDSPKHKSPLALVLLTVAALAYFS